MKLSMFLLSAVLALSACKKKTSEPAAGSAMTETGSAMTAPGSAATDTGPAIAGSAAATTPVAGSAGGDVVVDAGAAGGAAGSATGSGAGSATGSTGARPDCVLYAKVAKTCGHGLREEPIIADECERALTKNTVMAGSINIQIACAKADPACGAFNKCVAKH